MNYELDYLTQFASGLNEQDIFILIGDHQPPVITQPNDGSETMMHILSKNQGFIESFSEYGFSSGLKCTETGEDFGHQDILWPLASQITQSYGQ